MASKGRQIWDIDRGANLLTYYQRTAQAELVTRQGTKKGSKFELKLLENSNELQTSSFGMAIA